MVGCRTISGATAWPSEQRYMDVACERFRTVCDDFGISVGTAWRTTPPVGELSVWGNSRHINLLAQIYSTILSRLSKDKIVLFFYFVFLSKQKFKVSGNLFKYTLCYIFLNPIKHT